MDKGNQQERLQQAASWLRKAKRLVVLTGAGMSTESGIPDFRSKDGWWREIDPRTVATTDALAHHYSLFHDFYRRRIEALHTCQPHQGHRILADWEQRGMLQAIATQNVDGLHQQAGSREVYELHGSIRRIRCVACHQPADQVAFGQGEPCRSCGGKLRPDVVLFGEMLPERVWQQVLDAIRSADLLLVIGSSLQVYPVNQLPAMTDGRTVLLNAETTELDHLFDLTLYGKAGGMLGELDRLIH